jgi:hypothetical protein
MVGKVGIPLGKNYLSQIGNQHKGWTDLVAGCYQKSSRVLKNDAGCQATERNGVLGFDPLLQHSTTPVLQTSAL